jgi:nitrate reductase NapE component
MRKSYFVTPRSLGECSFYASADPIERPTHRRAPIATTAVVLFVLFLIVAATVVGAA